MATEEPSLPQLEWWAAPSPVFVRVLLSFVDDPFNHFVTGWPCLRDDLGIEFDMLLQPEVW